MPQKFLSATYFLWAGILIGVSFMATPVKFSAPHLTLPVALEVGRATFHLLIPVEWIFLGAIAAWTHFWRHPQDKWLMPLILSVLLLCQTFWLLPLLDARVDGVIAGSLLPPAPYHKIYIAIDLLKLSVLLYTAWNYLKKE